MNGSVKEYWPACLYLEAELLARGEGLPGIRWGEEGEGRTSAPWGEEGEVDSGDEPCFV